MSDFTRHGKSAFILLLLFLSSAHRLTAQSEIHRADALFPDNPITRVEHSNGYTMISGSFTSVGGYSGGAAYTDMATGAAIDQGMPKVNGEVYEIVSDGNGGWYLGGYFESVDTVRIRNLVHIKSDKTIDRAWKPNPDSAPSVLKVNGTTLFVGGYFTEIAGQTRRYLASFSITTGALNAWNPDPNSYVEDLEVSGTQVIVGGSFTLIGAAVRTRLAAISIATGLPTSWAPNINSQVTALALDGTGVFVGGFFTIAGGAARSRIARIDLTTGLATGPALNLDSSGSVYDLEISGGTLYLAGFFVSINGFARNHVASMTLATSAITTLDLGLSATDYVTDLALDGTALYIAGSFSSVGGVARTNVAAVNATSGVPVNWNPVTQDYVACVVPGPGNVWIGGAFTSLNSAYYNGFVLIEEATNTPWPFQVDVGGTVNSIAVQDDIVYLGGQFTSINKTARTNLAALDLRTGTLLPWDPRAYGLTVADRTASVNSIKIKDNLLFIGGRFYALNNLVPGTVRPGLAAVELSTGAVTSWNPLVGDGKTINQYVNSIDIVDNTLYAGGAFDLLNLSVIRNNVAAISTTNGNILPWDPNSSGEIFRVRATPSVVFVAGTFQGGIGGALRPYGAAALEVADGKATAWNPDLNGTASDVAIAGDNVYVAGYFSAVTNEFRPGLASFLIADGSLNDWTPDIGDDGDSGYSTFTLSNSTSRLFVGGNFRQLGDEARAYYAEYDLCPAKPTVVLNGTTLSTDASGVLQWYANGDAIANESGPTFEVNPLEYGQYAVSVTQYGCEVFSDDAIYVVTALESTRSEALKAYPNPVEDVLTLEIAPIPGNLDITITDIMGRVMRTEQNTETRSLSFAGYRPGPYLLIIQAGDTRYVKKIMKIR